MNKGELEIVQCPTNEIICQSMDFDGKGNGRPAGAKRRSNPIFEDEDDMHVSDNLRIDIDAIVFISGH